MEITMHKSWRQKLSPFLESSDFKQLTKFLKSEKKDRKTIFPPEDKIFSAFQVTALTKVKVVIIGQDPYHGDGQAHGLSFSVKPEIKIPPSLKNIYKEIHSDLGHPIPEHGHLIKWAKQGVLLLNSVLTVEKANAGSHQKKGWEQFTDKVIEIINEEREDIVFLLWGAPAQKKAKNVNPDKHYILKAPHPSPLSSYRGFFGCKHFSKCNAFLESKGITSIDWSI